MADCQDIYIRLAKHDEAISNLIDWQKRQNSSLEKMADQIEKMRMKVEERLNKLSFWIMALLGSAFLNLLLLILRRHL